MSTLAIVLIALVVLFALLFAAGAAARGRRTREGAASYAQHLSEADQALEAARAADRGWDRGLLEDAARSAIEQTRPGWRYEQLELVLVDDRPGIEQDRAHFVARSGDDSLRVVLGRRDAAWVAEEVG